MGARDRRGQRVAGRVRRRHRRPRRRALRAPRNGGFAYGCNLGAARGIAPYLMFLNPTPGSTRSRSRRWSRCCATTRPSGWSGRALDGDGSLEWSLRRYPRLRSTYAQALFLHRVWPAARWIDELIRDEAAYLPPGNAGVAVRACMLIRRDVFEAIGGWDEDFFLYAEDIDICRRVWLSGHSVRFEPAPRSTTSVAPRPRSERRRRLRPAAASSTPASTAPRTARLETFGVALGEATHALTRRLAPAPRRGRHGRAARRAGPDGPSFRLKLDYRAARSGTGACACSRCSAAAGLRLGGRPGVRQELSRLRGCSRRGVDGVAFRLALRLRRTTTSRSDAGLSSNGTPIATRLPRPASDGGAWSWTRW